KAYTAANAAASVAVAIPSTILKTKNIGKISVKEALKKFFPISFHVAFSSRGYFLFTEITIVRIRYASDINIPGTAPAKNISPTERFDNQAIMIMTLLGGMITPTTEAEAFNAAVKE